MNMHVHVHNEALGKQSTEIKKAQSVPLICSVNGAELNKVG